MTNQRQGEIAILIGASIWGLFWIPLYHLNNNGVTEIWAVVFMFSAGVPIALAVAARNGELNRRAMQSAVFVGFFTGMGMMLYFAAMVYTDVIRVIFLFYMLPIWATLLSWLIYREPIGQRRLFAIFLALFGLWLLLAGGSDWPLPESKGDWMALASGFCWALCLVRLKRHPDTAAYASSALTLLFGAVLAIPAALAIGEASMPSWPVLQQNLLYVLVFGSFVMLPAIIGQVWGARYVPAPRAALITMSEIIVAVTSAWLLIGTEMPPLSLFGGLVIIIAVIIDITSPEPDVPETLHGREAV